MANPVVSTLTADTWTKIQTSVQKGTVYNMLPGQRVFQTLRATGQAAPTGDTEKVIMPDKWDLDIASAADVYVFSPDSAGKVRSDFI